MVQRWRQLPLDHALSCMPAVRALLERLADGSPEAMLSGPPDLGPLSGPPDLGPLSGPPDLGPLSGPPDLGPGVVMDQLTVLVYDLAAQSPAPQPVASSATSSGTPSAGGAGALDLAQELATLRRELG